MANVPQSLRSPRTALRRPGGKRAPQAPANAGARADDPAAAQPPQRQDQVAGAGDRQAAAEAPQAGDIGYFRDLTTDNRDRVDSGRFIAPLAVISLILISAWDVAVNHAKFDPQALGVGIGAILGGLAAYLYGDAKHS